MNIKNLFFITSLLIILLLLLLSQTYTNQLTLTGKITKINYYTTSTILKLENTQEQIIIFTPNVNLKENQTVQVTGKKEIYQNNTQILADKIVLITV